MICESEFKALLNKNPIRHCKRCAKAVCKLCSDNKKQLSKDDPTKYRVCDECDTILENYELQYEHQQILQNQQEKIEKMEQKVLDLDGKRQERQEAIDEDKRELEEKLQQKYNKKKTVEQQLVDLSYMIQDLNAAKTTINETMSEQDQELEKLKAEKARI